jgi:hypothetical protein
MPILFKASLAIAVAMAAVVALATLADVLAGIVATVAILVFTRAIMDFAAEPGEKPQRSARRR